MGGRPIPKSDGANMVTAKATLNTVEKVGKNTKKGIPIETVNPVNKTLDRSGRSGRNHVEC